MTTRTKIRKQRTFCWGTGTYFYVRTVQSNAEIIQIQDSAELLRTRKAPSELSTAALQLRAGSAGRRQVRGRRRHQDPSLSIGVC
jgi:hypothetical protein